MPAKEIILTCRIKSYEDIPEEFKCCEAKINILKKFCAAQTIFKVYVTPEMMFGHCNFCNRCFGERPIFHVYSSDDPDKIVPVEHVDIDEAVEYL